MNDCKSPGQNRVAYITLVELFCTKPLVKRVKTSAPGETRTHTGRVLNPLPLPIGLPGRSPADAITIISDEHEERLYGPLLQHRNRQVRVEILINSIPLIPCHHFSVSEPKGSYLLLFLDLSRNGIGHTLLAGSSRMNRYGVVWKT